MTALSVLAPVLMWLVADPLLGHRLRIEDGERSLDIHAVPVGVVALLASLSGWGLLASLERFGVRRARAIWTGVAGAVLVVSLLPFIGDGMDSGTRVSLALMHLAVAAVLVPGLGGRPPRREPMPPGVRQHQAEGPPTPSAPRTAPIGPFGRG
ncbi:DUF6069 family protein [Streptomyces sp. SAI-127]|uniref:DUF6069 family protein n=1 Tax=Streptomyces sp. SAI-127 TaxID=2940543 RepID=UPI002473E60E|nr:DUF6069 family protein [Streptomyces sp. SAI-127]